MLNANCGESALPKNAIACTLANHRDFPEVGTGIGTGIKTGTGRETEIEIGKCTRVPSTGIGQGAQVQAGTGTMVQLKTVTPKGRGTGLMERKATRTLPSRGLP